MNRIRMSSRVGTGLRRLLAGVVAVAALPRPVSAAVYQYDLGTGTGIYDTFGPNNSFTPAPPAGGGQARVTIGTGGGRFSLLNPGDAAIGSATELQGVAPISNSVNKFSIYDYTASKTFHTRFSMKLTGGASGTWYFFQGDGASFSDGNPLTGAHVFTGISWTFGAGGAVTTNVRNAGTWTSTGAPAFAQNSVYQLEVYGNNSTAAVEYRRAGVPYTVDPDKWDLWLNGTRTPGLAKGGLVGDATIDSFMFYGMNSSGNVATIILDDFQYGGDLATVPVALSGFEVE